LLKYPLDDKGFLAGRMTSASSQKQRTRSLREIMARLLVGSICFFSLPLYAAQHDSFSAWFVDPLRNQSWSSGAASRSRILIKQAQEIAE